jgi:hypothetical protein
LCVGQVGPVPQDGTVRLLLRQRRLGRSAISARTVVADSGVSVLAFYQIRCDSYGVLGQVAAAIGDCRQASERGSIEGYFKLAWWEIVVREWDAAVATAVQGGQVLAANAAHFDEQSADWYRARLRTMQAHALFLAGRIEEALAIYRELRQGAGARRQPVLMQALDEFRYMRAKGLIDAADEDQARQIEALLAGG